jgi:NAD(P)-dependent dehydrogenase (short-subunit alcohol dehydrogenase family)
LGRVGTKSDIGLMCVFLATAGGDYVNGETIAVDGGNWLWTEPPMSRDMVKAMSKKVEAKSRNIGGAGKSKL